MVGKSKIVSLSLYDKLFRPSSILVARRCTPSSLIKSDLVLVHHTELLYSSFGQISVLYNNKKLLLFKESIVLQINPTNLFAALAIISI